MTVRWRAEKRNDLYWWITDGMESFRMTSPSPFARSAWPTSTARAYEKGRTSHDRNGGRTMSTCFLCGLVVVDKHATERAWDQRRFEVVDLPSGKRVAIVHPRCWELLQGLVTTMVRLAQYPALKAVLA